MLTVKYATVTITTIIFLLYSCLSAPARPTARQYHSEDVPFGRANPRPIFLRSSSISNTFAVIGGSEAYNLLKSFALQGERIGQIETPFGESQALFKIDGENGSFLFLSRHGEKGYSRTAPYVNYRANIYALKEHGVKQIISWSGPGAIFCMVIFK